MQKPGDAIFLGLTAHGDYRDCYGVDELKALAKGLGYDSMHVDECFIRHAIDAGYTHIGKKDIHHYIIDYHQTYIFVKGSRFGFLSLAFGHG